MNPQLKPQREPMQPASMKKNKAAELLVLAGLPYRVPHSSAQGVPLGAQANHRRFKMLPCDVGLYSASLFGIRTSLEPFSEYGNVRVVPLHALGTVCGEKPS